MSELKPCPFCGADAELIKSTFGDSDIKKEDCQSEAVGKSKDEVKKGYIVKIVDNFYNSDCFYAQEPKVKRIICELWRYGKFYVRSVDSGGLIKSVIYEHPIPAQLVEIVSPIKMIFTPEQVAEAEAIIGKIVVNCMSFGDRLVFVERDKETIVAAIFGKDNRDDLTGVAKCAEHHEYNETILKMIALCKATKAEIPGWCG